MDATLVAVLLVVGSAGAAWFLAARRISFWKAEGIRVLNPGHLCPLPRRFARLVRWMLGYAFVFLFIGRLRVVGRRNLRKYRGRLVVLGNHQTERDAILIPYLMRMRPARYFIAKNQAGGWRAPLVAYTGGIVVEHDSRRGPVLALRTAIEAMVGEPNTDFVIFPQGQLYRDNALRRKDFYAGAAVLGSKVRERSGADNIAYLPVAIYYDRDPAHATFLHRLASRLFDRALTKKGFEPVRSFFGEVVYGATVVIGEPIEVSCLPDDPDKATDELFERIVTLCARAEKIQ